MVFKSNSLKWLFAGLALTGGQALFLAQGALAQEGAAPPPEAAPPLIVRPRGPGAPAGQVFTDSEGTWERVPMAVLYERGPHPPIVSGIRVGRGSLIPADVDAMPFRNVSIRGLAPYGHYVFFVSPDNQLVVFEPTTRRVVRVISAG